MRRTTFQALAILILSTIPSAAGEESWVGKRVITKFGTVLKVGKQVVDDEGRGYALAHGYDARWPRVYRVERTNGPWLWLADELSDVKGWMKADRVVPFEKAADFLDAEVKARPASAAARIDRACFLGGAGGDFDRAISHFTAAIRNQPNCALAYYARGAALVVKGEGDRAMDDFGSALRVDPSYARALVGRAQLRGMNGDGEGAFADITAALRLPPEAMDAACRAEAYLVRSHVYWERGQLDQAIADIDRAIVSNPRSSSARHDRGAVLSQQGHFVEAVVEYGEALRLNPKDPGSYTGRGIAFANLKQFDRAIADHDEAIRLDPNDANAYFQRGSLRGMMRDHEAALPDLDKAIRLGPGLAPAYINRSNVLCEMKQFDDALADLDVAVRLAPDDAVVYYSRGGLFYRLRDFERAIKEYDEALRLKPDWADAVEGRGLAYLMLRRFDDAIAHLSEAIKHAPNEARHHTNRGSAYAETGRYAEAAADYAEAVRIDPHSSYDLSMFAWFLSTCPDAKYRDGRLAVTMAKKACDIGGQSNPILLIVLAAAHAEAGDFDEAVKEQEQAIAVWEQSVAGSTEEAARALALFRDKKPYRTRPLADEKVSRAVAADPEPR
jgi:tetratricopeptide (TPR) repeat protein